MGRNVFHQGVMENRSPDQLHWVSGRPEEMVVNLASRKRRECIVQRN
jgi:hypothetical protein